MSFGLHHQALIFQLDENAIHITFLTNDVLCITHTYPGGKREIMEVGHKLM